MSLLQAHHFQAPSLLSKPLSRSSKPPFLLVLKQQHLKPTFYHQSKKQLTKLRAVIDTGEVEVENSVVIVDTKSLAELRGQRELVDYDWTEEWYPLYLAKDVPDDAPLGLTVYDQQLVLFRDGNGDLQCYQDRCPHRYNL